MLFCSSKQPNADLLLSLRPGRWHSSEPTLRQRLLFLLILGHHKQIKKYKLNGISSSMTLQSTSSPFFRDFPIDMWSFVGQHTCLGTAVRLKVKLFISKRKVARFFSISFLDSFFPIKVFNTLIHVFSMGAP